MYKVRKGDTVSLGKLTGKVICTGVTSLLVDFGEGFTCLVNRTRFWSK